MSGQESLFFFSGLQHSDSCRFAGVYSSIAFFTKARKAYHPGGDGGLQKQKICGNVLDVCEKIYWMCARKCSECVRENVLDVCEKMYWTCARKHHRLPTEETGAWFTLGMKGDQWKRP
jgi:hypothetical protein